jgi:hypothetical protein
MKYQSQAYKCLPQQQSGYVQKALLLLTILLLVVEEVVVARPAVERFLVVVALADLEQELHIQ